MSPDEPHHRSARPGRFDVIVPLKGGFSAKSRLSSVLNPAARQTLMQESARHVLQVLFEAPEVARVLVVTADGELAAMAARMGAAVVPDRRGVGTLDAYLQGLAALRSGPAPRAPRVLMLNADLPRLSRTSVDALARGTADVVIAPDRHGVGTNALLMAHTCALELQFGTDSFPRHVAAAQALRLSVDVVKELGLGLDLDEPADLRACREQDAGPADGQRRQPEITRLAPPSGECAGPGQQGEGTRRAGK